jgi:hypothetical protein
MDKPAPEILDQGGGAESTGEQGGDGYADLNRRQEPVRIVRKPGRALAAPAPFRERPDLALAQRHEGHLSGGEETSDENEGKDDQYIPADAVHVASLMSVADRGLVCRANRVPGPSHAVVVVRISLGSRGGRLNILRGRARADCAAMKS